MITSDRKVGLFRKVALKVGKVALKVSKVAVRAAATLPHRSCTATFGSISAPGSRGDDHVEVSHVPAIG